MQEQGRLSEYRVAIALYIGGGWYRILPTNVVISPIKANFYATYARTSSTIF